MSLPQRGPYQNGSVPARPIDNESDDENEALSEFARAQMIEQLRQQQEELGGDLSRQISSSMQAPQQDDLKSRLQAAAEPLERQAPMEVRFSSYDNYCSLFHFILNSDGPVDLDMPTVCFLA